jgi:ATP synthase protein I
MLFGSKKDKKSVLTPLADGGTMGRHLVASTFSGMGMGWYLDKWLGTKPWLLLVFLILGIVAGFRNMFQEVRRLGRQDAQENGPTGHDGQDRDDGQTSDRR